MGKRANEKYSKRDLFEIINKLGFSVEKNQGKISGKGSHTVFYHEVYRDLKIVVTKDPALSENEMSNIGAVIIITMRILGIDPKTWFKNKEGIEGKLGKIAKQSDETLFKGKIAEWLNLRTKEDIDAYIKRKQEEIKKSNYTIKT